MSQDLGNALLNLSARMIIIAGFALLFACKKNVAGPKGESGPTGKNGNLDQYYTSMIYQPDTAWTLNGKLWESYFSAPIITSEAILEGEIKIYLQVQTAWYCLPYVEQNDAFTQYAVQNGIVRLSRKKMHLAPGARPVSANYRLVVFIPRK